MALTLQNSPPLVKVPAEEDGRLAEDPPATWNNRGVDLGVLGQFEEALKAFEKALRFKKDFPQALNNKGVTLSSLGRYTEAFACFDEVFDSRGVLQGGGASLYQFWATLALAQGLDAMLTNDIPTFKEAGYKYIDILERAEQDGMGQAVEDALVQFKDQLKKRKDKKAFEEVELFARLMKIKDPLEGWRALSEEISKVWPKGVSAVEAIREQRGKY